MFKKIFQKNKINTKQTNKHRMLDWLQSNTWKEHSSLDYQSCYSTGYMSNVVAFRAVKMIAMSIASIKLTLSAENPQNRQVTANHHILSLLQNPNPFVSGTDLMEELITHILVNGNAYILKIEVDDIPRELYILRPDRVSVLIANKTIIGYRYTADGQNQDYFINQDTGKCSVLHIKNFHPLNDVYGFPTMGVAMQSIKQHWHATQWNCALLKNSARPSGALIVKNAPNNTLTEEQYLRIKEQVDELYSGYQNSGKPVLLEGGLEWKEMSISPKDMDFVEIKNSAARDIALSFGVPSQMLGIPGDNTYSNLVEARIAMWEQTILPTLDRVIDYFNKWLVNTNNLFLSYNKDDISALVSRREKIWSYINDADFMTSDEKRKALGLGPTPSQ